MIYVDGALIQADVTDQDTGRTYSSRWCHLFSDQIDQTELHEFAARIGLKREWFQPGKRGFGKDVTHDPVHDHYDLTANKRKQAVKAGACEVDIYQAVEIWEEKRRCWSGAN